MELQVLWFILITVLFIGFFFLEGFDYGVGILHPFIARTDRERRVVINTIGPVWDGNEVWLITAGGAMFAAFPNWYATLFSGFYLALFLILIALILRGVSFEFRSKDPRRIWRRGWDWAIFFGSALPAFLWGVAFANIVRGVPIDENMHFVGSFFDLLNPYALLGGAVTFSLFTLHGALFLELRTDGVIRERAKAIVRRLWVVAVALAVLFVGMSAFETTMFSNLNVVTVLGLAVAVGGLLTIARMSLRERYGMAFLGTSLAIVGTVTALFATLFPRVMPSSLGAEFDLTIFNASSSQYTLQIMTVVALALVPVVLAYQAWTYWVFRKRVTTESHLEY